jgi:hypothetical protein
MAEIVEPGKAFNSATGNVHAKWTSRRNHSRTRQSAGIPRSSEGGYVNFSAGALSYTWAARQDCLFSNVPSPVSHPKFKRFALHLQVGFW